jgi:transcriptional regulator with XRE-family HTH domain
MSNTPAQEPTASSQILDYGARLKCIRERNGLSQRELAKRAGVPHSSVSMIEQGLNSPSINSLVKILSGFPMSIAHFFSCDTSSLSAQIFRSADLQSAQCALSDTITTQKIALYGEATQAHFARVIYAPGADTGARPHSLTQAMSGFIVSGTIELTLNAQVCHLLPGDAFALVALQAFRLRNLSPSEDCIMLSCLS